MKQKATEKTKTNEELVVPQELIEELGKITFSNVLAILTLILGDGTREEPKKRGRKPKAVEEAEQPLTTKGSKVKVRG